MNATPTNTVVVEEAERFKSVTRLGCWNN